MAYVLVLAGLLLIFLEFYLPGAVLGTIGGLLVLAGLITFAYVSESVIAIVLFYLATFVAIGALIRFALWRIPRAKPDRSIYSNSAQNGYYASSYDKAAIGKQGKVVSDLKPGGHVMIEGKMQQAISVSGYLRKGEKVEVIGGEGESLVVKQVTKE